MFILVKCEIGVQGLFGRCKMGLCSVSLSDEMILFRVTRKIGGDVEGYWGTN